MQPGVYVGTRRVERSDVSGGKLQHELIKLGQGGKAISQRLVNDSRKATTRI